VRTGDRLQGTLGVPLVIPDGVEYTQVDATTWPNLVSVANGGRLNLNPNLIHTFNGGLVNEGHVAVLSGDYMETSLRGAGITNRGLFEVQHSTWNYARRLFAPILNEAGGTFQVNDGFSFGSDDVVTIESGGGLILAGGTFFLGTNAELRFVDASAPAEVLTVGGGAIPQGDGTIRFQGNNLLVLEANADFGGLKLIFEVTSSIQGNFTLANALGGSVTFNSSTTVPGSMTIAGILTVANPGVTVIVTGTLTLEPTGVLNNPGTIQVGAFVDNGGTINGNPPIVAGGGSLQLAGPRLEIDLSRSPAVARHQAGRLDGSVRLTWHALAATQFWIETSGNLASWITAQAMILEVRPGQYQATLPLPDSSPVFFRLRWQEPDPTQQLDRTPFSRLLP
jgi:hypothetical protein